MIGLNLDPQGRIVQFDVVPPQLEERLETSRVPDWAALFGAAGLDTARFASAAPRWLSLAGFDARAAWTGTYAQSPAGVMRVWVAISCLLRRLADRADADQRDHPNVINDHLRLPPTL